MSAGVNVLALQRMLGHAQPSMTLNVYADLFDSDLDAAAAVMHSRYAVRPRSKCAQNVSTGCPRRLLAARKTACDLHGQVRGSV